MAEKTTEDTGLMKVSREEQELSTSAAAAWAEQRIKAMAVLARQFPRDTAVVEQNLEVSCKRPGFAWVAQYSFPRAGKPIVGPSVNLAREFARLWGNIICQVEIVRDDDDTMQLRGWAWDLETNVFWAEDDIFKKLIERKQKGGGTYWKKPDERDMRELKNRRGAILERNCLLRILPRDMVEEAQVICEKTKQSEASKDPKANIKVMLEKFQEVGVTAKMLGQYLGHSASECTPKEITTLRSIYQSLRDGNSEWEEYMQQVADQESKKAPEDAKAGEKAKPTGKAGLSLEDLKKAQADEARTGRDKEAELAKAQQEVAPAAKAAGVTPEESKAALEKVQQERDLAVAQSEMEWKNKQSPEDYLRAGRYRTGKSWELAMVLVGEKKAVQYIREGEARRARVGRPGPEDTSQPSVSQEAQGTSRPAPEANETLPPAEAPQSSTQAQETTQEVQPMPSMWPHGWNNWRRFMALKDDEDAAKAFLDQLDLDAQEARSQGNVAEGDINWKPGRS